MPSIEICLIANVGQRDLHLHGKPLDKVALRAEAERVLREMVELGKHLSMPMLDPAMEFIVSANGGTKINRVILVGTNQEDERFRPGDTIPCAEIMRRLILSSRQDFVAKGATVVPIRSAPHLYDRMMTLYRAEVFGHSYVHGDKVYLLCTGGTPACNTALMVAGIERFRERCQVLHVSEGNGGVVPLSVGSIILGTYRREAHKRLLDSYQFDAVASDSEEQNEAVKLIAEAAARRLNFDFEGSYMALSQVRGRHADLPSEVDKVFDESVCLKSADRDRVMRELYWNGRVKWETSAFADFLGRLWRLIEESL
ncbi:MAG: hypothetical protein WC655_27140, partial [Candidatus Hydrogenedentales bacterium]